VPDDIRFDLDLAETLDALMAYKAWSQKLNSMTADQMAGDLQSRLRMRVLQAFARGALQEEIPRIVANEFANYTGPQLATVTQTTVMDYYNTARHAAFEAAGDYVQGVRFVPLLDATTTPFCRDIVGRSIVKTDPLFEKIVPPFWYNCRTMAVPVTRMDVGWVFNTDWPAWLSAHRTSEGGGFLYAEN
jgi:SPP1 gp7 family putative phage head morphogenesis protein